MAVEEESDKPAESLPPVDVRKGQGVQAGTGLNIQFNDFRSTPAAGVNADARRGRTFRHFQFMDRRHLDSVRKVSLPPFVGRPVTWTDVVNGPSESTGFIEREATERLRDACSRHLLAETRAYDSGFPLLVVTGAPGAGKTTLVRKVACEFVLHGDCVVADFGINRRPPRASDLDDIVGDIRHLQEAYGNVLLVLDDPFTDEGGFIPLLEELASARINNVSAIAASPTLLFDRNAWKLDYGVSCVSFILGRPTVSERREIATIYGRELEDYAQRKDDLLVLTLEAASGEDVQDIVLRTWRTLNGGSGIDPSTPPRRLPWLVRAYMMVCALSAFGQVCQENILHAVLESSGDDFEASSDLGFALDSLVAREGWHIFVISKSKNITASHGTVARLALSLRPAKAFDPAQWLLSANVIRLHEAAESLAYLISARLASDREDGLVLSDMLGEALERELAAKTIDMSVVAAVFEALPVGSTAFGRLASRLQDTLVNRANAAASDSWLAALILESRGHRNFDFTRGVAADLVDTIPVADLSIDPDQARKLISGARSDPRLRRLMLRKSLDYLKDGEKRGLLSSIVASTLTAAPPQDLRPYFSFLAGHLYRYPHDVTARVATLRAIPFLPSSQSRKARWFLKETEAWLDAQPDDTTVRRAWWLGVVALEDESETKNALRKIARWADSSADRPASLVLAWLLNPRHGNLSVRVLAEVWHIAMDHCDRVGITALPHDLVDVLPTLYLGILEKSIDNRYEPLLREIYDFIALWYWGNKGSMGPELPRPGSRL